MHHEQAGNHVKKDEVRAVWMMASPMVRATRGIVVASSGLGYMGQIQRFDEGQRAGLIRAEAEQGAFDDLAGVLSWLDGAVRGLHKEGWRVSGRSADAVLMDEKLAVHRRDQATLMAALIQSKFAA